MNTNCSQILNKKFQGYLKSLDRNARKKREMLGVKKKLPSFWPAASVGCEYRNFKHCSSSGSMYGKTFQQPLKTELEKLGPIGAKICGNTNGACAEDNAANEVLKKCKERTGVILNLSKLCFTKAVRARTRKVIKPCANCKKVFK